MNMCCAHNEYAIEMEDLLVFPSDPTLVLIEPLFWV